MAALPRSTRSERIDVEPNAFRCVKTISAVVVRCVQAGKYPTKYA